MRVTVHYMAQIKRAAGCATEEVETASALSLRDFLRTLADGHDASFRAMLLDGAGEPRKSLLFFVGDGHADLAEIVVDGATVTILAPMSGG